MTPNGYHTGGVGAGGHRDGNSPPQNDADYKYGRFDASALHIAHALKQTELQKAYNKPREKPIDYYLVREWFFQYIHLLILIIRLISHSALFLLFFIWHFLKTC